MDRIVQDVLEAVERQDWPPAPPPAPPSSYELRDGQVYRWTA